MKGAAITGISTGNDKYEARSFQGKIGYRQLHSAMAAWREGVEEVRRGRSSAAAALAFMRNATLWAAWRAWLEAAIAGQQKRLQQLQAASCFRFNHKLHAILQKNDSLCVSLHMRNSVLL